MLKNLERRVFTEIQGRLFPYYFLIQGLTSLVQLAFVLYVKHVTSTAINYQEMFVVSSFKVLLYHLRKIFGQLRLKSNVFRPASEL